jgi:trimethylamine--corrinoid protein Co-methyltransferase
VEAIDRVGPGGHFLIDGHTLQFMRSELFHPALADRQNRAAWEAAGGEDSRARAITRVQALLRDHRPSPLAPGVDADIRVRFDILLQDLAEPEG